MGNVHDVINNCLSCGHIVCEKEGEGTCMFCGNLVYSNESIKKMKEETEFLQKYGCDIESKDKTSYKDVINKTN